MNKSYYVYILTNKPDGVLYVGATNDLSRRFNEFNNGWKDLARTE